VSADPTAPKSNAERDRYSYVGANPLRFVDPSGLYLLLVCGWGQTCDDGNGGQRGAGDIEQWKFLTIEFWRASGRFGSAPMDLVWDLFAGALSSASFSAAEIVRTFDAFAWDPAHDQPRRDLLGSAEDLARLASNVFASTGEHITYLAGFSWGGATINEYLWGVLREGLFGTAPRGVYYVGAPNIHAINNKCPNFVPGCDPFRTYSNADGNLNVRRAFGDDTIRVVARSAPIDEAAGVNLSFLRGRYSEINGGVELRDHTETDGRCRSTHCVSPWLSYLDAQDLFY
jgi:hypothetical protein